MVRKITRVQMLSAGAFAAIVMAGCGQKYSLGSQQVTTVTGVDSPYVPAVIPPGTPTTVPCDPLNPGAGGGTPNIAASLYTAGRNLHDNNVPGPARSVEAYFAKDPADGREIYKQDLTLFFTKLDVPLRAWTDGFAGPDGEPLKKPGSEEKLVEYFALRAKSNLKLAADDSAGNYQLGLNSDDGSNLYVNGSADRLVDNDGTHSQYFTCAKGLVNFANDKIRIPVRVDYYQGPQVQIALQVMWRKVDGDTLPGDCDIKKFTVLKAGNYDSGSTAPVTCEMK